MSQSWRFLRDSQAPQETSISNYSSRAYRVGFSICQAQNPRKGKARRPCRQGSRPVNGGRGRRMGCRDEKVDESLGFQGQEEYRHERSALCDGPASGSSPFITLMDIHISGSQTGAPHCKNCLLGARPNSPSCGDPSIISCWKGWTAPVWDVGAEE